MSPSIWLCAKGERGFHCKVHSRKVNNNVYWIEGNDVLSQLCEHGHHRLGLRIAIDGYMRTMAWFRSGSLLGIKYGFQQRDSYLPREQPQIGRTCWPKRSSAPPLIGRTQLGIMLFRSSSS